MAMSAIGRDIGRLALDGCRPANFALALVCQYSCLMQAMIAAHRQHNPALRSVTDTDYMSDDAETRWGLACHACRRSHGILSTRAR